MTRRTLTKTIQIALTLTVGVLLSATSWGNLITNGDFELFDTEKRIGGAGPHKWALYQQIPGWEASRTFEIWRHNFLSTPARSGQHLLELNAHGGPAGPFAISQSFATVAGTLYNLTFSARARNNTDEAFRVTVGDLNLDVTSHVTSAWTDYSVAFVAAADVSELVFESLDSFGDTTGNLVDRVGVAAQETPSVPSPPLSSLLVLLAAFRYRHCHRWGRPLADWAVKARSRRWAKVHPRPV